MVDPIVYDGVYHTPPVGRLAMVDTSTFGIVSVPKWSPLDTPRRELSEDVSLSVLAPSWLSGNRARKTAPEVCYIHHRIRHLAHGVVCRTPFTMVDLKIGWLAGEVETIDTFYDSR